MPVTVQNIQRLSYNSASSRQLIQTLLCLLPVESPNTSRHLQTQHDHFSTTCRQFSTYNSIQAIDTSLQNQSGAVPPPRFLYDKITHLFPHSAANSSCKQFPYNHQKYLPQQFGTIKVSRGGKNSSEAPFQFSLCLIITLFAIFTNSLRDFF